MKLSEDMIYEIFSWLSAKSICRFKSCSKSIYKLTQETYFALKQSQHSMTMNDSCLFIQPYEHYFLESFKTEPYALPGEEKFSGAPKDFLRFLSQTCLKILASSNGLLLCQRLTTKEKQLYVCNPITKSCLDIPFPTNSIEDTGSDEVKFLLECDDDAEEYKIILVEYTDSSYKCKTFMPKEGVWKSRGGGFFDRTFCGYHNICDPPLIHKGAIHLMINSEYYTPESMIIHHLESGSSRFLGLALEAFEYPGPYIYLELGIFKWGKVYDESICFMTLFEDLIFSIWVLVDYESSSWSRYLTINLEELLGLRSVVTGFTIMNGTSLIFATISNVYKYDLVGERKKTKLELEYISMLGSEIVKWDFISFSPTLQSCGLGATTLSL